MLNKFAAVFFLGLLSQNSVALATPGACTIEGIKLCYESATGDISTDCAPNGGVFSAQCSAENRYGSCVISQEGQTMTLRYYKVTPVNPEENCSENGGQFILN